MFVLNLKTYPSALGPTAVRLARALESAGHHAGVRVAIAPPTPQLGLVAARSSVPVLAQHVEPSEAGASTGSVPPEAVAAVGGRGSLVNHSERPLPPAAIRATVRRLDDLGLAAVVCAPDDRAAARWARLRPPYLAVEPPELIGGDRAVSTAKPELVAATARRVAEVSPETAVLCGAGVHSRRDVARALELGSRGVLVASAVVRSQDPDAKLADLLSGF